MRFIEKLLDGVEIDWKALGKVVTTITAPSKVKKEVYRATGKTPIIDQGKCFIAGYTDENISPVKSDEYIVFGDHSEHIKYVDFSFVQGADGLKILKSTINNTKYIYYAFQNFYQKELSYKRHWSTAKETLMPIPPLNIQIEIVRILDTFTTHTAELTAELTAREKQYNYYRDQLLTFEDGQVEWKTLGEIGEFIRGNGIQKKDFVETGFPAIHYGQIFTRYGLSADKTFTYISDELSKKSRIADKNNLLIATTSENDTDLLKPVAWLGEKAAISGDMLLFRHNQNVKYLAYYFQTEAFQKQKIKYITGEKVRRVSGGNLERMTIPIPHLAEQARTVDILDKFDALTNSISEGLPREIKLRQQQYEYYRDLLLSFPKSETTA